MVSNCSATKRLANHARLLLPFLFALLICLIAPGYASAQPASAAGGEAELKLPDLGQATFLGGITGSSLLMIGLGVCALGLLFGLIIYTQQRFLRHVTPQ